MRALMRWQMGDPAKVYERMEEGRLRGDRRGLMEDPFGALWRKGVIVMTRDESEQIEELLLTWYRWAKPYTPVRGAPRVSPYGRNTSPDAGNVHDDQDEVDARIAAAEAETVDACLNDLTWESRAAVGIHVANKAAGAQVYRNARMTVEESHQAYQQAKVDLLPLLHRRGMMRMAA
jgi:hypothetical protein